MSRLTTAKKQQGQTPLDRELEQIDHARGRLLNGWMLKKIASWKDVGSYVAIDDLVRTEPLNIPNIKLWLEELRKQVKEKYERLQSEPIKLQTESKAREVEETRVSKVEALPEVGNIIPSIYIPQSTRPYPNGTHLFKQQEDAAAQALDKLFGPEDLDAFLLRAGVGSGKTYVAGADLNHVHLDNLLTRYKSIAPWPIVYVTKASIVEQTERVIRDKFGLDVVNQVIVTNYDSLRATFGSRFINWDTIIVNGEATIKPVWRKRIHPIFFIWDECQALKNEDSLQSQLGQAVNDIAANYEGVRIKQLFMSATPFTRVCEAKCFAVATRVPYSWGVKKDRPLDNRSWPDFARDIAAPSKPDEYNESAIERLVTKLSPWIGGISNLRPQFHARNGIKVIDFDTPEESKEYFDAWEAYLIKKAEIEMRNERL